jgi:hypothetical protein
LFVEERRLAQVSNANNRSAEEVFDSHLSLRNEEAAPEDVCRDYAGDVVLLTGRGVYRGHAGVRRSARRLREEVPAAEYEYCTRLVEGETAFLEWTARSDGAKVEDGADSSLSEVGASPPRRSTTP